MTEKLKWVHIHDFELPSGLTGQGMTIKEKTWTFFDDRLPPNDGMYWVCCKELGRRRWITHMFLKENTRPYSHFQAWMPSKKPRPPKDVK